MSLEHDDKIVWVDVGLLKENPKNRNKHPKEQIERLVKIIKYQGWRAPIVVSNRSGYIAAGHGRLMAAKKLELSKVPVSYQDFESEEQETSYGISDNAIALWADLDFPGINQDVIECGPDIDVDLFGIKDFEIEPEDKYKKDKKQKMCPSCGCEI